MSLFRILVLGAVISASALVGCKGACVTDEGTSKRTASCTDDISKGICESMSGAKFHSGSCAQAGYGDRGDGIKVKAGAKANPKN